MSTVWSKRPEGVLAGLLPDLYEVYGPLVPGFFVCYLISTITGYPFPLVDFFILCGNFFLRGKYRIRNFATVLKTHDARC